MCIVHASNFSVLSIKSVTNFEICRACRATIPLSSQPILDLCVVPNRFYEFLNVENQMCELCSYIFPNPVMYI